MTKLKRKRKWKWKWNWKRNWNKEVSLFARKNRIFDLKSKPEVNGKIAFSIEKTHTARSVSMRGEIDMAQLYAQKN